jgi:hypothetical protein
MEAFVVLYNDAWYTCLRFQQLYHYHSKNNPLPFPDFELTPTLLFLIDDQNSMHASNLRV